VNSTFSLGDGLAIGGTPLFSQNFATLWGDGNVLTILSIDLIADYNFDRTRGNLRFGQNVARWAAGVTDSAPVPEPSTFVLFGTAAIGALVRRRRARSS
jgi:hypothetical protein